MEALIWYGSEIGGSMSFDFLYDWFHDFLYDWFHPLECLLVTKMTLWT